MGATVALIPARKGSKRVPRKNVRILNGKPLIQYSIEHALAADAIDSVYVSTDDEDVFEIAKGFDCEIIERPVELASDTATTIDVIKHSIEMIRSKGIKIEYLVLLQPTVPIRDINKINEAIKVLKDTGCDSVVSHIPVDYFHPNRMKKIHNGKVIPYCEEEIENVSRDYLPKAYYRDGSIYAMRSNLLKEQNTIFGNSVRAVVNNRDQFINIDDERDWLFAEILMKSL